MRALRNALVAGLMVAAVAACQTTPRTGAKKPTVDSLDFTLPQPDGTELSLASLKGQVVLVDTWATWCAPCKDSFPFYSQLQDKYREQGFRILAVTVDEEKEAVTEFLEDNKVSFTVLYDPAGSVPEKLKVTTMPTAVLIGKDGKVTYMHAGFVPEDQTEIEAHVRAALGLD